MSVSPQWLLLGASMAYMLHSGTITFKQIGMGIGVLGCGALFLLYKYQEMLLYQPRIFPQHMRPQDNPPGMREPTEAGMEYEDVRLRAEDGTNLHAWFIRPADLSARRSRPTVLFLHENAGNMGLRMQNLQAMQQALQVNILILSYRGYGESEGVPSEEGLYKDGEAAMQWLLGRTDIDRTRIVLFGRSLGGGVAIDIAAKHEARGEGQIAAIVVENTFASISDMVDVVFPLVAVFKHAILRMRWDSKSKIKGITKPILFLSGAQDEIVPASQMRLLYDAATRSTDREFVVFPEGRHNDTWQRHQAEYMQRFKAFLEKHAGPGRKAAL